MNCVLCLKAAILDSFPEYIIKQNYMSKMSMILLN
jgi:hypothetical protein